MQSSSLFRRTMIGTIILVLLLCTVGPAAAQSGSGGEPKLSDSPITQLLLEKASHLGSLRVILTLNTVFQPEGSMAGTAAVNAQREAIGQIQQALVDRIAGLALDEPYRFETVPLVVATLNEEGLKAALESGLVTAVQEDLPDSPTLAESTPLIGATAAWASGFTGTGQTVAILDTGVDKTHPFLAGKVVSEGCYSTTDPNYGSTSVCPGGVTATTAVGSGVNCNLLIYGCEHGTHVAGIAAGKGTTFSGVAKDASIVAVQVFSRFDTSTYCQPSPVPCALSFTSDQIKGLERIYLLRGTLKIASVNMSLGGDGYASNCDTDSRKPIIDQLRAVGIATVVASGNNGYTNGLSAPACISSAVSVGSTGDGSGGTTTDVVSYFSNSASFLKLLAPGAVIYSSVPGGAYASLQGTSMAAPHVAGAWVVMKSKNPRLSVDQVLNALTSTGLMVSDARNGISKPRIRLVQALAAIPTPPVLNKKLFVPLINK